MWPRKIFLNKKNKILWKIAYLFNTKPAKILSSKGWTTGSFVYAATLSLGRACDEWSIIGVPVFIDQD